MNKLRELAKVFRELAELYDKGDDIDENKELNLEVKEKAQEEILGKIMVQMLKVEKLK